MTYEKKMRRLMERLASMSPEPPAYPEETTMVSQENRKRPNPALAFVGAAVIVGVLAIPVILFMSGRSGPVADTTTTAPVETTTTTPADTTTTVGVETTTTTSPTTTTTPTETTWSGVVFLFQEPENSFLGNPALVPLALEVSDPEGVVTENDLFTDVLAALGTDLPEDFGNAIPGTVRIESLSTESSPDGDHWVADMNESFLDGAGSGLLADFTMLNQLIYTIVGSSSVEEVLFTVSGEPITEFGSEGLALTDPVGREDFIDSLAPIFLTEPLIESGPIYTLRGMSNVFEATVNLAVLDGAGEIAFEGFTTAECGNGCWGAFDEDIPVDLITPGESSVSVFSISAEDGSSVDVVTVPIPDEGTWRLTIER